MHKYWGKKPSSDLKELIEIYSNEGDTLLDPFSGYGVFCGEAFLLNRNVIANDLNPIAHFINFQLLNLDIDIPLVRRQWKKIKLDFQSFSEEWYSWKENDESVQLISILRSKEDIPLKAKYKQPGKRQLIEFSLDSAKVRKFLLKEESTKINDWYPKTELIRNSRISAKKGMTVADLFTKRTLSCHARLLQLIETHSSGNENNLFKLAFTANLANCSKLVPPIKTRGEMSQGAWMTGFYTGETYIENNVIHYYENRLNKTIRGKLDYLNQLGADGQLNIMGTNISNKFTTLQKDAKSLGLKPESIDYVFTDPPYGDAVPYFEQSIIWNSWLKFEPDYNNEIVISDSKDRSKDIDHFEEDIKLSFAEISRVLKKDKYFSLTYHSLSGLEWKAITNACIQNGFELVNFKWLVQRSFTPRQINRIKSIKGDVLVTFKNTRQIQKSHIRSNKEIENYFYTKIYSWLENEPLDTNQIFLNIMEDVFSKKLLIGDVDLLKILLGNFVLNETNNWIIND
jgi:DNA modification methylase